MRATVIMVLTIALGIVPATWLIFWAVLFGAVGVGGSFQFGDPGAALRGLRAIVAAVLSLFDYVALFYAAGDAVTLKVARWLAGGIVANFIGVGFPVGELEYLEHSVMFMLFAPLVVGCAHFARFIVLTRRRSSDHRCLLSVCG